MTDAFDTGGYDNDNPVTRPMPDGKLATVVALTFARGRICIGPADGLTYDRSW